MFLSFDPLDFLFLAPGRLLAFWAQMREVQMPAVVDPQGRPAESGRPNPPPRVDAEQAREAGRASRRLATT